jgi:hypothetical protein
MTEKRMYCIPAARMNAGKNGLSARTAPSPIREERTQTVPVDLRNSNKFLFIVSFIE